MRRWDFIAAYLQCELEQDEAVYIYCQAPPPGYATLGADGRPHKYVKSTNPFMGWHRQGVDGNARFFPGCSTSVLRSANRTPAYSP
eukprot:6205574-Pleurochrysis_carterae.AAC.2